VPPMKSLLCLSSFKQERNQVAEAAPLISGALLKPVHEVPWQCGCHPLRFTAEQVLCRHKRLRARMGLGECIHQFNASWTGHEVGSWRCAASSQQLHPESPPNVQQMCRNRALGTPTTQAENGFSAMVHDLRITRCD